MDEWSIPRKLSRESTVFPSLDGTNYTTWKKNMRILLTRMGLLQFIQEGRPEDADHTWTRADTWAFSEIYFRCASDLHLSLDDSEMTAYDAWTLFADLYQSATVPNLLDLNTHFAALQQRRGQPAFQFITEVTSLAAEIRNMGDDISDQKIKFQILGHLLPEFAPLVTTLTNLDGQTRELDLRTLRESILREENAIARRLGSDRDKQPPPALPAFPLAHSAQIGCSHCGNSRHSVEQCWKRHPELKPDRVEPRVDKPSNQPSNRDSREHSRRRRCRSRSPRRRPRDRSRRLNRRPRTPSPDTDTSSSQSSRDGSSRRHQRDKQRFQKDNRHRSGPRPRITHRAHLVHDTPCSQDATPAIDHACMIRDTRDLPNDGSRWLLDSGASHHYTCDRSVFTSSFWPLVPPRKVETASGHVLAKGIGDVVVRFVCGTVLITDVMWAPDLNKNTYLLSIGQLEAKGLQF